jgi:hypothetical protein
MLVTVNGKRSCQEDVKESDGSVITNHIVKGKILQETSQGTIDQNVISERFDQL